MPSTQDCCIFLATVALCSPFPSPPAPCLLPPSPPSSPAAGPVSLLSGLNPRPSVLVTHFFMVALYGVGRCACVTGMPRNTIPADMGSIGPLPGAARSPACCSNVRGAAVVPIACLRWPGALECDSAHACGPSPAGCCSRGPLCAACGWACCCSTRLPASSCPSSGRVSNKPCPGLPGPGRSRRRAHSLQLAMSRLWAQACQNRLLHLQV